MSRNLIIGTILTLAFVALAAVSFIWTPADIETLDIPNKLRLRLTSSRHVPSAGGTRQRFELHLLSTCHQWNYQSIHIHWASFLVTAG